MLNRPEITDALLEQINTLIADHPDFNRTKISKSLCEIWDWRLPNGQLKDISCRDMLRLLDKKDLIHLPAAKMHGRVAGADRRIQLMLHDVTPVATSLQELMPLNIVKVEDKVLMGEFKSLVEQYHYLGFDRTIGENMKYMIYSNDGILLACMLFGSAAWASLDRDTYIGWSREKRKQNLQLVTDNTRFLILPWVNVPHLASHILSRISKRLSADWDLKYGHPIYCIETFVECARFKGTCYKAANWIYVGQTVGRGRDDVHSTARLPIKDILLFPLHKKFRTFLG